MNGLGACRVPESGGAGVLVVGFLVARVEPAPGITASGAGKLSLDLPIVAGDKAANLFFALDQEGQGWGLYAAHRGEVETAILGVEGGHGPGAVDADQPV